MKVCESLLLFVKVVSLGADTVCKKILNKNVSTKDLFREDLRSSAFGKNFVILERSIVKTGLMVMELLLCIGKYFLYLLMLKR